MWYVVQLRNGVRLLECTYLAGSGSPLYRVLDFKKMLYELLGANVHVKSLKFSSFRFAVAFAVRLLREQLLNPTLTFANKPIIQYDAYPQFAIMSIISHVLQFCIICRIWCLVTSSGVKRCLAASTWMCGLRKINEDAQQKMPSIAKCVPLRRYNHENNHFCNE